MAVLVMKLKHIHVLYSFSFKIGAFFLSKLTQNVNKLYYFCYMIAFQHFLKNYYSSCSTDLDFWDCFGKVKPCPINK